MKSIVFLLSIGICLISECSAAGIPKPDVASETNSVEPRHYHGVEAWSGPGAVMFAPLIAVAFLLVLWVAAYNTVRDAPPRFGVTSHVKPLERTSIQGAYPDAVVAPSNQAASPPTVGARAFDQLTHRVLSSIEKLEAAA